MDKEFLYEDITKKTIRCFYNVYDELGNGFLESVYEKSLMIELENIGLQAVAQKSLNVYYKNQLVGEFKADIIVEDKIIIEIKAVNTLTTQHEAQLINYLKATGIKVGLIVNFGDKLEFKRRVF
ncbi:MAG: GxxExxY protein [Thermodesulfovibrionia bacterium]|nr:GxxExxY protein [Thermodesulfovibrionia bacterium]MCK5512419.1 GxxExxY protein [Thermodesulfovibrionia bacterium]